MEALMDVNVFSDSDDDMNEVVENIPRSYVLRVRPNHFEIWNDFEFFARFRLTKPTFIQLFTEIEEQLLVNFNKSRALSPMYQLLLTLRFYATGNFLRATGDFSGVCISTASRVVEKVSYIIASLGKRAIKMPNTLDEIRHAQQQFYTIYQFPRVIGCIDCTHIKIQSPGGDIAETFRNRKGYFSLNVQAVCDANMNAINIVARWPGSTHDSTIFSHSNLYMRFQNNEYHNGLLLGDSGYPVSRFLLTPLLNPLNPGEIRYNEAHIRTRNIIERFFGVLKRRFPVLSLGMRLKINTIQAVIVATAYLHNMVIDAGEEEPPVIEEILPENDGEEEMGNDFFRPERTRDNAVRQALIEDYFTR